MTLTRTFVVALSLASSALARTDLVGCTYTDLVIQATRQAAYASRVYYVPDTGEVCDFLDCGGGRAPPKSTVPGCPLYTGTETYQPSYIDPKTLGNGVIAAGHSVTVASAPVTAATTTATGGAAASDVVSTTAAGSATSEASMTILTGGATSEESVTILTGSNTSTLGKSGSSSAAQTTSAASSGAASASKNAESSSGTAKTTSPSSAAGAMQTVGAVLGPCVVAAIAAGLA